MYTCSDNISVDVQTLITTCQQKFKVYDRDNESMDSVDGNMTEERESEREQ